ncbi:hypothetical protein, partial [Chromohalobacter sp. HP20-39]|uniref:hypothetical protein n=1 Tax=Chromohalobacter sp. HP20-39 TaxID=3079306 RepID=UPI00294B1FAE
PPPAALIPPFSRISRFLTNCLEFRRVHFLSLRTQPGRDDMFKVMLIGHAEDRKGVGEGKGVC